MFIFISLIPWFFFWIFASHQRIGIAAALGFLGMALIILVGRKLGRTLKSLQVGTLIFFALLVISVAIFGKEMFANKVDLLGNAGVLLIVLITILIRRPFSLDFLRERTDKKFWNEPNFIRANYALSWFFFFVLLLNFSLVAARHFSLIRIDRWLSISIRIFNCVTAVKLSFWYLRRKKLSA